MLENIKPLMWRSYITLHIEREAPTLILYLQLIYEQENLSQDVFET